MKLEKENFETTGRRRQLWCYGISAKRYALYTLDDTGKPLLVKWSEHGLGHLLNPMDPEANDRDWIRPLWEGFLTEEVLGQPYQWPAWLDHAAVGRITVSSPSLLHLFDSVNRGKPYPDQIKPFNFLLTAFVAPFGHPDGVDPTHFHLVAPYNKDPRQWRKMIWIDRDSGRRVNITTSGHTGGESIALVKTYGDVLREYRTHPEPKSLGQDGRPCSRKTRGLLSRRPVTVARITYIGKESNKLDDREAGLVHDLDEVLTEYHDPHRDPWRMLVLPTLQDIPTRMAVKTGVNQRTFKRVKAGGSNPHPKHKAALFRFAVQWARAALRERGVSPPTDDLACCTAYLEERKRRNVRVCPTCCRPLTRPRARYCDVRCKQRMYRERKHMQETAN